MISMDRDTVCVVKGTPPRKDALSKRSCPDTTRISARLSP